jgi:hypothetical protein
VTVTREERHPRLLYLVREVNTESMNCRACDMVTNTLVVREDLEDQLLLEEALEDKDGPL